MTKKLLYLFLIIGLSFFLSACNRPTSVILFNKEPIKKENLLKNATLFTAGKRIYYIFITEKPLKVDRIRVRILKRDEKAQFQPTKVVYSNDFKVYKDQVYYYDDYVVINDSGYYCMVVYPINSLDRPLAIADFRVKN